MNVEQSLANIPRFVKRTRASLVRRLGRVLQSGGCYCVCCGKNSPFFLPFAGDALTPSSANDILDVVGSDLKRYSCPKCESNDRERHLKLYCQRLGIDRLVSSAKILHFAPERHFSKYVAAAGPSEYFRVDLFPASVDIQKVDMLAIPFPEAAFDIVIANHVLEHVADDARALFEIHRVLRPGGVAILQTPYSAMLKTTFEDVNIVSGNAREHAYGQSDHVRLYGQDIFLRFCSAGFVSRIERHETTLADCDPEIYGVNSREPFFLFERT